MNIKLQNKLISIILLISITTFGQNVDLYQQYTGQYDFTFIGNTLNQVPNTGASVCTILTTSSADLTLSPDDEAIAAYLYWSGSGTGDNLIKLNDIEITPERTFSLLSEQTGLPFFSFFTDITSQILSTGNGNYTVSDFDVSDAFEGGNYCNNATNYAGWAIVIVYQNQSLPINQINIYDGLQAIPRNTINTPEVALNITLSNLNVIDNEGAKIGFLTWEGDENIAVRESLFINGNLISNPPLNPATNVFNGTNSITGSNTLYNMDLDIFDIQNNIAIGDDSALIQLTSGQDFVMVNSIVTKLNNQSPDATIVIDAVAPLVCNSREITLDYTVSNFDGLEDLPAGIPIAVYSDNTLLGQTQTVNVIPIDGSESGQITVTIPNSLPYDIEIRIKVDDLGNGIGIQSELIESNNNASTFVSLLYAPFFNSLTNLFSCVENLTSVSFDFSSYQTAVLVNPNDTVQFFNTLEEANLNINPILNFTDFVVNTATTTIFVRLDNANCFSVTSFDLNLIIYPAFNTLNDLFTCRVNENSTFDFSDYDQFVVTNSSDSVQFFESNENAIANLNPIQNTSNYLPSQTPKEIFVSIYNGFCYSYTSFFLDYNELPTYNTVPNMLSCNEGLTSGTFNFMNYDDLVRIDFNDTATFFESLEDAQKNINQIFSTSNYKANQTPKEIFIRIEDENCFTTTSFLLTTENCPPIVYNYISANGDAINATFFVEGLRDVFVNFKTEIYNRWGTLVWTGNNTMPDWDGLSNQDIRTNSTTKSPRDTYFYVIYLNDPDYIEPLVGYLYLFRKNER